MMSRLSKTFLCSLGFLLALVATASADRWGKPMSFTLGRAADGKALIFADGDFAGDTAVKFDRFLNRHAVPADGTVVLNSRGGDLAAGMDMGRVIRGHHLATSVGAADEKAQWMLSDFTKSLCFDRACRRQQMMSFLENVNKTYRGYHAGYCMSACSMAFLGGVRRDVPPMSYYGVHQFTPSCAEPQTEAEKRAALRDPRCRSTARAYHDAQTMNARLVVYINSMGVDSDMLSPMAMATPNIMFSLGPDQLKRYRIVTTGAAPTKPKAAHAYPDLFALVTGGGNAADLLARQKKQPRLVNAYASAFSVTLNGLCPFMDVKGTWNKDMAHFTENPPRDYPRAAVEAGRADAFGLLSGKDYCHSPPVVAARKTLGDFWNTLIAKVEKKREPGKKMVAEQKPAPHSAPAPHPAPAVQPPAPGAELFAMNFKANVARGHDAKLTIKDGDLMMRSMPGYINTLIAANYHYRRHTAHADIHLRYVNQAGSTPSLVFWVNADLSRYLLRAALGYFTVIRFVGDREIIVIGWTAASSLKTEVGASNELAVLERGDTAYLLINGRLVGHIAVPSPARGDLFGVACAGNVDNAPGLCRFSKLWVAAGTASRPPPPPPGTVLFTDDFKTRALSWGAPTGKETIGNGWFEIAVGPGHAHAKLHGAARYRLVTPNVAIRTRMALSGNLKVGGSNGGLVFWGRDNRNFYEFVMGGYASFSVNRIADGKASPVIPLTVWDPIKRGPNALNEIEVIDQGDKAYLRINGKTVGYVVAPSPAPGDMIGLECIGADKDRSVCRFSGLSETVVGKLNLKL